MYKLIACDLDETLLDSYAHVTPKNVEAIRKACEKGVKFVLATGRGYETVQGTLEELGLKDIEDQYVMSFNGGALTENKGNRMLHFEGLTFEKAEAIYKYGIQFDDICVHVYTKDTTYVYNYLEGERKALNGKMPVTEIFSKDIDFLKDTPIVKCLFMNFDREYLQRIEKDMYPIVYDCDVSYSSNRYIEFNKKGVNKGQGLRQLAELLNIDIKDTIAIGDNLNDLPMIEAAGLGVGVANTIEVMKDKCDYICENDFRHDAVAEVIEKFVL